MYYVIAYDVCTETKEGRRRLRQVAQTCKNFGLRVQHSVFECQLNDKQFYRLKTALLDIVENKEDSLRFYRIREPYEENIEHHGIGEVPDPDDQMII